MAHYIITITVLASELNEEAGKLEETLNEEMHGFGFPETLSLRTSIPIKVVCDRKLSLPEQQKFINNCLESYSGNFPSVKFDSLEYYQ